MFDEIASDWVSPPRSLVSRRGRRRGLPIFARVLGAVMVLDDEASAHFVAAIASRARKRPAE